MRGWGKSYYEIAFGHHRLEAVRRLGLERIPLIVRELSDEEMLKFMVRENQEDFNANCLIMLETWEAAVKFCASPQFLPMGKNPQGNPQALDVAKFLGWTYEQNKGDIKMTPIAPYSGHRASAQR